MNLIRNILKYKSLAITGLDKNTGKTECLNYILSHPEMMNKQVAVTSIGIDGESIDLVSATFKPEITLRKRVIFSTSEQHYKIKKLTSEIIDISVRRTSLGRLVTAQAISDGKIILSGPSETVWLKEWIENMLSQNCDIAIVDGAISRLSSASPVITEAMVLTTGASVSSNLKVLTTKTKFTCDLIALNDYSGQYIEDLKSAKQGVWAVTNEGIKDLNIPSMLMLKDNKDKILEFGEIIYVSGAVTDSVLDFFRIQKNIKDIKLIVSDFTKIFVSKSSYDAYVNKGGQILVIYKTNLIAVCVNPSSPTGYYYNSDTLCKTLSDAIGTDVFDVRSLK